MPELRIVSLLPSATEIVCALGLADALVGISHDCDYPPEVLDRPVLSQAVVGPELPSGAIEEAIRGQVHRGLSVYHLDADALAALRPTLILTQELCRVCAPSYTLVREAARILEGEVRLVSLEPRTLAEIIETIRLVGELTDRRGQAEALVGQLRARLDAVRAQVAGRPRPRVACLEWLDPLYAAGHWVPEMVEAAGGEDVLGRPGEHARVVAWDAVRAAAPEALVLMPCGFDVSRTRREAALVARRAGWGEVPAVPAGRVYAVNGSAFFNRPGPRIVRGVEILAGLLHPEAAPAPEPGEGERLDLAALGAAARQGSGV
ncbi:MAG: cobalamin-binding protein [Armatimonadota bacterium]|nr:cobalamin-binding protein [Armatimonadota bacterium]MDR7448341.1 cobalamin-binding protein [Armatimonadota bacterium]MDR7458685.1 cobalamin-binding protein [Armatimonadota bacterium]MDR7479294.1 cobalamin-binding protein [Armatimonadota bacterium]MDR7487892.1 cobalamin-binding protein [Armatimonadota bacterium]